MNYKNDSWKHMPCLRCSPIWHEIVTTFTMKTHVSNIQTRICCTKASTMTMQFHPSTVQTCTPSPLGTLRLAASPQGLAGVWFDGQRHLPDRLDGANAWPQNAALPVLQAAVQQLKQYFAGTRTQFELPLDLSGGTPFQQAVWQALLCIGYGRAVTYGALAQSLDRASAVRAVAAAVGRNPLSLVVPCHRVLGASGHLTGYAGGLERKAQLLAMEGVTASRGNAKDKAPTEAALARANCSENANA